MTDGGTICCWGATDDRFWDGTPVGNGTPPDGSFLSVSTGGMHTCGIRADQTVSCWGSNHDGQTSAPSGTFKSVSAGYDFTCAVRVDGTMLCWGYLWRGFPAQLTRRSSAIMARQLAARMPGHCH